jgi:hypothetical protein
MRGMPHAFIVQLKMSAECISKRHEYPTAGRWAHNDVTMPSHTGAEHIAALTKLPFVTAPNKFQVGGRFHGDNQSDCPMRQLLDQAISFYVTESRTPTPYIGPTLPPPPAADN